jgi:imidazolonepropionase-like amidohydrolase
MLARILVLLVLGALPAHAQTTIIRAGHLVDPAKGTVTDDQVILVEEGTIRAVGEEVSIPAGAVVVDLPNSWVLPGLMDAHTHLTLRLSHSQTLEDSYQRESTARRALRGIRNARILLEAGVTTVRDVGNAGDYADTDLRKAIEEGWFPGPTIINSGKIIAPFGGQSERVPPEQGSLWQYDYIDADSPEEVRKAVRQNLYYGATVIKLVADWKNYHYTEEELRAAVETAHQAGVAVAVHAESDEPARLVIRSGADSIEHGTLLSDDVLRLMKKHGTFLVGTDFPLEHLRPLGPFLTTDVETWSRKTIDRLRRAHRIGVPMAFGTDVVSDLPGKNRAEMLFEFLDVWLAADIPPAAILKAMTTDAAMLLRIQDERGAVRAGMAADLIAVPGNPLEDIHILSKVQFVMKDGRIIMQ